MFLQIALKNIFSNKKRSIVTLILTALSTTLLVFSSAFMDGSHTTMIKSSVEIYPGYIQVTQKDFRDNPSLDNILLDVEGVTTTLSKVAGIQSFGARFETFVLYSSASKAVGGRFTGIEPEQESRLSRLKTSLKEGRYLTETDAPDVYIGTVLAEKLQISVGDELSFIGTGADYSFAADNLRVIGTFQTGLYDFDSSSAFVSKLYFDRVMAAENMATHVIVLPTEPQMSMQLDHVIGAALDDELISTSWQESMSGLVQAMKLDSIFGYITLGIIFIVIFFVIMIYTLLAVFTRIHEIGILRAIGTQPGQIFRLLMFESIILALTSVIIGGCIGGIFAYYFHHNPIVFSGYEEQFKQYGLAATAMPTAFSPATIFRDMTIMFLLAIGSTFYPVFKVTRYKPIEAIQHV